MGLLDNHKDPTPIYQAGKMCLYCLDHGRKRAGVLQIKQGKYGSFFSCSRYPVCQFSANIKSNLENKATNLLKEKRPKKRRGKRLNKIERQTMKQAHDHYRDWKNHL